GTKPQFLSLNLKCLRLSIGGTPVHCGWICDGENIRQSVLLLAPAFLSNSHRGRVPDTFQLGAISDSAAFCASWILNHLRVFNGPEYFDSHRRYHFYVCCGSTNYRKNQIPHVPEMFQMPGVNARRAIRWSQYEPFRLADLPGLMKEPGRQRRG